MASPQRCDSVNWFNPEPFVLAQGQPLREGHQLVPVVVRFAIVDIEDIDHPALAVRGGGGGMDDSWSNIAVIEAAVLIGCESSVLPVVIAKDTDRRGYG